ncbi:hypothetical protein [Clostridium magnum]|uniref:Uncharacterized protein n=1 Tax=Clostridium magnum DSM 2767 TaxID=1121326 RepID=A0A161WQ78_9CLOT|nr:hypothetical protein [Clostridium magnum]KZL88778.1 hypothetical protein CLMAG_58710 [Clostridium magnum DSM 2767]SHJ57632.1 hypothetical protein SAMN02745944_06181 [Clostridium magnum DSM 2767]
MVKWLEDNKPYDAIVCWLIGTHGFRRFNEAISEKNLVTPGDYRFAVQNRVYEKADELLRRDGVLQIVDRCETPNKDEIRDSFLESHRDQASVTSLLVTSLEYLEYDTNIENGAKMNVSTGNQITITDKIPNMSFISVISVKP